MSAEEADIIQLLRYFIEKTVEKWYSFANTQEILEIIR